MREIKMTNRIWCLAELAVVSAAILALTGCVSVRTRADDLLIGYSQYKTYETRVPLILMWETGNGLGRRKVLVIPMDVSVPYAGLLYSGPPASDLWGPCPTDIVCWEKEDVIALVPTGTLLTVDRLERVRGWNAWYGKQDDLIPFASFTLRAQTISADVSDLSIEKTRTISGNSITLPEPNPAVILGRE